MQRRGLPYNVNTDVIRRTVALPTTCWHDGKNYEGAIVDLLIFSRNIHPQEPNLRMDEGSWRRQANAKGIPPPTPHHQRAETINYQGHNLQPPRPLTAINHRDHQLSRPSTAKTINHREHQPPRPSTVETINRWDHQPSRPSTVETIDRRDRQPPRPSITETINRRGHQPEKYATCGTEDDEEPSMRWTDGKVNRIRRPSAQTWGFEEKIWSLAASKKWKHVALGGIQHW